MKEKLKRVKSFGGQGGEMKTLILIFVLLIATCLYSTIINVPADQPTIQAGIDAAAETDTVLVADGTYFENIDFIGKAITVASNFLIDADTLHIENTIINGSQPINPDFGSVVTFISNEDTTSVITGFTLTEGLGTDSFWGLMGGGIYIDNSSPSIISNIVRGNTADCIGGLCCISGSNPRIINNVFSDNVGLGSIGCLEFLDYSNAYLEGNIIKNNYGGAGNGIGGIAIHTSSPTFINNIIVDNATGGGAGGIYIGMNSSPVFVNCIISGNTAIMNGGGIYISGDSNPSLVNLTITGNSAGWSGGGIYCRNNSNPDLTNCIMWNDSPQEIFINSGSVTATYSNIENGWAGIGNIDEDPLFVGTGVYTFSLLEDSPCIDAGNPDPIYYDPQDPTNPGYALFPAMGTTINDMGAYGGPNAIGWLSVGVEDNVIVQTPEIFLYQNYPNPFNPTTTIKYQLPENSKVELTVYNLKGQKVKQLVSEQLSAGRHSVVWNGKDNNNKSVSSGIYFYKLKTANFEKTRKMILLK